MTFKFISLLLILASTVFGQPTQITKLSPEETRVARAKVAGFQASSSRGGSTTLPIPEAVIVTTPGLNFAGGKFNLLIKQAGEYMIVAETCSGETVQLAAYRIPPNFITGNNSASMRILDAEKASDGIPGLGICYIDVLKVDGETSWLYVNTRIPKESDVEIIKDGVNEKGEYFVHVRVTTPLSTIGIGDYTSGRIEEMPGGTNLLVFPKGTFIGRRLTTLAVCEKNNECRWKIFIPKNIPNE